jgi:4-amino-4-deoxy-L-arabinose transferase-like glycosyltransferase
VTQNSSSSIRVQSPSLAARVAWIVLILATLYICYFYNLGAIGFVGPDEPRYAWIARDIVETGDWITPRLYGQPWFEKPVLYYWEAAFTFKLFGVSEAAARFPSALSALFATLAMAWLAWRLYGKETALWLLLLLPTTFGMIGFSHAAATDMPFSGMLTIAMVCAAVIVGLLRNDDTPILPRTPWFALILFGFFLGLAVLAKGPAAIVLSGGAVLLWAIFTKRWRGAFRCLHPLAIASFCVIALPWYIVCAGRNPEFLRIFLVEHNFKRYLTPEFQHIQPFWFYFPILLLAVFPWTLLLLFSLIDGLRSYFRGNRFSQQTLFLVCWPLFCLFFFTISKSKLPGYILPAIPPLALLLASSLTTNLLSIERPRRWLIVALGTGLVAAGIAFFMASDRLPAFTDIRPVPGVTKLALTAGFAGVSVALLGFLRRPKIALLAMVVFLLVLVVKTNSLLSKLDSGLTARRTDAIARERWPEFSPSSAATWQLKRSLLYQLNFYTHTKLAEWTPGESKPPWLIVEPNRRRKARGLGFVCAESLVYPAVISCKNSALVGGGGALGGEGSERGFGDGQVR